MTDLVTTARTARERLALGLNALQNPGVPETLLAAAEPIAQAMSALHQIERSGALPIGKSGPTVLDLVRQALAKLQAEPSNHPALITAMEAVAGSLGLVFGLVQRLSSAPPPPASQSAAQPVVTAPPVAAAPRVAPMQSVSTAPPQRSVPAAKPAAAAAAPAAPRPQPAQSAPADPRAQPAQSAPAAAAPLASKAPAAAKPAEKAQSLDQGTLVSSQAPFVAQSALTAAKAGEPKPQPTEATLATAQTMLATSDAAPAPAPKPMAPAPAVSATAAAPAPAPQASPAVAGGGAPLQRIAAELGAHSATNFYKGLGGNDVIDSGGIFVATYQVPEVGKSLLIRVSLPGGYEFEAKGVVRWTREPSPNSRGDDVSPGFGAQFTEISQEARQLVYRYARNREPLFHDDM